MARAASDTGQSVVPKLISAPGAWSVISYVYNARQILSTQGGGVTGDLATVGRSEYQALRQSGKASTS